MITWYNKYTGLIDDPATAKQAVKDLQTALKGKQLVLYGAGVIGSEVTKAFKRVGIQPAYILDADYRNIGHVGGFAVHSPALLKEIPLQDTLAFGTVGELTVEAIRQDLQKEKIKIDLLDGKALQIALQSALCTLDLHEGNPGQDYKDCYDCGVMEDCCTVLAKRLKRQNNFDDSKAAGSKKMRLIGYILGQRCSLNCKSCCESIPYFPADKRKFVPAETVVQDIQKLAKGCAFLTLVEFVGGEPFLHPGLAEILRAILAIQNVGIIHIFTNGTMAPSPELAKVLAHSRIVVYVSNYSKSLSREMEKRMLKTESVFDEYGISYLYGYGKSWFDFSSYDLVCVDEKRLPQKFHDCFLHNCPRLYEGVLYACPHHYAGLTLGVLTNDGETVSIHDYTDKQLVQKLEEFKSLRYVDACRYCKLPYDAELEPAGIQMTSGDA